MHDANVTIRVCEHGALIDHCDVAPFLLASDIRRTLAEVAPPPTAPRTLEVRASQPGGLLLRFGAAAFALSLCVPAANVKILWSKSAVFGLFGLVFGPLVAVDKPVLAMPVLANFFALALLIRSRRMGPVAMMCFALVFGAGALFAVGFGVSPGEDMLAGYWLWCAALALFACGTAVRATSSAVKA